MRQFLQRRVVIEGAPRDQTIKKIIGVLNKRWDGKVLRRRWNKNERAKESCKKMQRKIYLRVFFAVKRRALCSIVSNANQTKRSLLIEEYLHNSRWSTEKLTESVPLLSQFEWPPPADYCIDRKSSHRHYSTSYQPTKQFIFYFSPSPLDQVCTKNYKCKFFLR